MSDWQDFATAFGQVAQAQQPVEAKVTWTKGVVYSVAPLRVRKFGSLKPIELDPVDLVGDLQLRQTVWLQVTDGYVVVHGRVGG